MIPVRDDQERERPPILTWTLVALNVLLYFWDRQWHLFGPNVVFADLMMRPNEVVSALGGGPDRFPMVTVMTSMFLHGNLMHLLGNMVFLVVFGSGIEEAFGALRFLFWYAIWGIAAAAAQIYVDPASPIPTLGASGAIGGVLGAYLILFPANRIELVVPLFAFLSVELPAWILLGVWFLFQIFLPQEGVANWAHAGGFLAVMVTVLLMGGRSIVLRDRPHLVADH